jgi:hypothetical protein
MVQALHLVDAQATSNKIKLLLQGRKSMRIDEVLQRIQGEYVEMPGLRLTTAQAQRLWGLERDVCDALLGALVDAKFLDRTRDGAFVRREGALPKQVTHVHRGRKLAVAS